LYGEELRSGVVEALHPGIECGVVVMTVLDLSAVNVALPSIQRDLRAAPANLQWVVVVYGVAFGAAAGVAAIAGSIFGRLLVQGPGWQWVFYINVPVGVVLAGARAGARGGRRAGRRNTPGPISVVP
jgi:MFS family permease